MTFLELAIVILQDANAPLTSRQIWKRACQKDLDKTLNSRGKTPQDTLAAILYVNVRDKVDSPFILASRRPTLFG